MLTINIALEQAVNLLRQSTESPQLDAEILLSNTLGKSRAYLRTWPQQELQTEQLTRFNHLIALRQQGQPIAYLSGSREFWSRDFIVTPDVLIPRPETESLIEHCLKLTPKNKPVKLIDLGTGSGIIAITLAAERPDAYIIATDISTAALAVAQQNAEKHQVKNIRFIKSHWFVAVPPGKFDFILSNPPYIAVDDPHLDEGDLRFEPKTALIADANGLGDIKTIAVSAYQRLENGGYLMFEHGYNQQDTVQTLLHSLTFSNIETHADLAGIPRVTTGQYLPLKKKNLLQCY